MTMEINTPINLVMYMAFRNKNKKSVTTKENGLEIRVKMSLSCSYKEPGQPI